ncbi:M48 family metallopeptidase [Parabacteroides sp. FAFU027]|uniref:M48 family metallopeptidase n=1 Tax=Parabacteroides sp. FAFU027 TaxID=2922715 RepID=UPI001FAFDF56|nr:YgjP-like metallopeptidase domain-containing protein [Parabacteroides sp. FAFU027]
MKSIYSDSELGNITIRLNSRAKKVIFKLTPEGLLATIPPGCTQKYFEEVLNQLRPRLLDFVTKKNTKTTLDESCSLKTHTFSIRIFRMERENFYFSRKAETLHIACPMNTDFEREEVRNLLVKGIERFLKADAKAYLPQRIRLLAERHKLNFNDVKINSSRGRWGSCSTHRSINLSFYLMLLPSHLIDYVLLHELTHTLEMNHSDRFWRKLDEFTGGQSLALRHELKAFKTHI